MISSADHEQIFPKVLHSIYNLHNRLLGELDYTYSLCHDQSNSDLLVKDQKMKRNIGSVMLEYAPLFRMYQIYMNTYERSQKALTMAKQKNRRFAKWLQVQPAGNLENLLILPVRQIPFVFYMVFHFGRQFHCHLLILHVSHRLDSTDTAVPSHVGGDYQTKSESR